MQWARPVAPGDHQLRLGHREMIGIGQRRRIKFSQVRDCHRVAALDEALELAVRDLKMLESGEARRTASRHREHTPLRNACVRITGLREADRHVSLLSQEGLSPFRGPAAP